MFSRQLFFCTRCLLCVTLFIFRLVICLFSRNGPSSCTAQSTTTGPPSSGETSTSTEWQTLGEGRCHISEYIFASTSSNRLFRSFFRSSLSNRLFRPLFDLSSQIVSLDRQFRSLIRHHFAELFSKLTLQSVQLDQDLEAGLWTSEYLPAWFSCSLLAWMKETRDMRDFS
jgi:hypothetical protein